MRQGPGVKCAFFLGLASEDSVHTRTLPGQIPAAKGGVRFFRIGPKGCHTYPDASQGTRAERTIREPGIRETKKSPHWEGFFSMHRNELLAYTFYSTRAGDG